jgi:hypothetical protein
MLDLRLSLFFGPGCAKGTYNREQVVWPYYNLLHLLCKHLIKSHCKVSICDTFPNVKINFLYYASIIQATKTFIKKSSVNIDLRKLANPFIRLNIHDILRCKKSKFFYEMLNKNPSVTKGKIKWSQLMLNGK